MTCRHDVRKVSIDPELFEDDKEIGEDLIAAAVKDAVKKVEETTQEKMSGITGAMAGMPGMPF
jgi:DNA-binding YbaB/EbfC family protein